MSLDVARLAEGAGSRVELWTRFLEVTGARTVAEIGVYRGRFAAALLDACPRIETYYMIDPWRNLADWNKPANTTDERFEGFYREAMERTAAHEAKRVVLRGTTTEVVDEIPDGSLDFAYVDGDHTLRGITIDLIRVWPKVREGGWIGGDDFCPSIWQHDEAYEPTLVFPYAVHFAEAAGAPIHALGRRQFLIEKRTDGHVFADVTGRYGGTELGRQLETRSGVGSEDEPRVGRDVDYTRPVRPDRIARGGHRKRVGGQWEELGQLQLDFMIAQGLRPEHRLLDVGCGALRAGRRFVDYLDPGGYYGIDVNQSLLDAGYEVELTDAQRERLPRDHLRATDRFACDFGVTFDFAIANSVFTHISLNHIRLCLFRVATVMEPGARFFASYFEAPRDHPLDEPRGNGRLWTERNAFFYYRRDLRYAAEWGRWELHHIGGWGHPRHQRMMEFRRVERGRRVQPFRRLVDRLRRW